MDADIHAAGETYKWKNTPARRAADGKDFRAATESNMEAHREGLKQKGMTDSEVDAMKAKLHEHNERIGVYDDPLPASLYE